MWTTSALLAVASGLALGMGLIVAIGAQNAFVLRQGLRLEHVAAVVAVCALSDLALILAGVLGAGAALSQVPWLIPVVCFAGAAFLLCYGALAARRALRPGSLLPDAGGVRAGLAATVGTCLALTWLNPHVYLDTVVLLGSMASTYGEHRWQFAAGAGLGSTIWFTGLGFGARLLRPVFARPAAWRVLDGVIAVVMTALAVSLALRGVSGS
ncbi:L-lysine exporter family protein LysE/ArgO [Geodermatophilus bullaregiensis]|uniref:LysE/ArgO family amino acid transporter n=1 Tax=Geodermatophilus bullaregiensis TaxID=1564160 RepID=UPI0027DC5FFB|nr:LysE/ArgO family amino acid transporter [Geodermatophilus bullaregiensis]MBM7808011.1 L-lysine exporter family protein LysE/ArgO [Geodermatophilus bullaregiensis]